MEKPYTIHTGDCRDVMAGMDANSVDAIVTDPPYFKVKGDAWDRQWADADKFLEWIDTLCAEWCRLLKANGSLYVFASLRMAARVECVVARRFNVLCSITWKKPPYSTKAEMFRKGDLRSYFQSSERVIFAEHYGADNAAKGEAGYVAKCDELRGFVFEPLRAYLAGERGRAGFTTRQVAEAFQSKTGSRTVTGMAGHWLGRVQWALPTRENYDWLRALFNAKGSGNGAQYLRREYEDLRREYEDRRRPFVVTADVPYTDVWEFATVAHYRGKHPCEKPEPLMRHIIESSTRAGAVVLDPFMGSGTTGVACQRTGRKFIGIELNPEYVEIAERRIGDAARIKRRGFF